MFDLKKYIQSKTGMKLLSIMLGLAIAGVFKYSCDSRSCIVFQGPSFNDDNKVIKVNGECYEVTEKLIDCEEANKEKIYV